MHRIRAFLVTYMSRHRHPWCRALHVVGVPMAPWGGLVLLAMGHFTAGIASIVLGYFLQWIGHRIEGSEMGDWAMFVGVVKWLLRMVGLYRPRPRAQKEAARVA
jgi:Protein of unknown function (DUF962)